MTQKMEKEKKATQKLKTAQKWRLTFTATAHATFPLAYPSKNDLIPAMMFVVETGNRNPHVKKHDLRQRAKIKDDIRNAKTTNVKLYIMYWFDYRNMIKSENSNLLYDFKFKDLSA